jgi:HK97 family phage portal protein
MPILAKLFGGNESRNLNEFTNQLRSASGSASIAGPMVSADSAMRISTVYACTRVIAESIASLPLILYRREGRNKHRHYKHPLYRALHDEPNEFMGAMTFRETLTGHLVLRGNAYCEIDWDWAGNIRALYPLRPDRIEAIRIEEGEVKYFYRLPDGEGVKLPAWRVLHVKGLSPDGYMGYNPIAVMRNSIGLAAATEEYGSKFFSNGAKPGVVLKHPGTLGEGAFERLRESWEDRHRGLENANRVAILEEGMSIDTVGIAPEDAQFLDTRKFQRAEIAGQFRVPLHMIGDLERATFSNIEQQSLDFVIHTLRPWFVRWEQEIGRSLLVGEEKESLYAEHLVDALLRGDIKSRYESYASGIQNGFLSVNDVRSFENLNEIEGGDAYNQQMNLGSIGAERTSCSCGKEHRSVEPTEVRAGTESDKAQKIYTQKRKLALSFMPAFEDAASRLVRRESNDIRRAVDKHLRKRSQQDFSAWLSEFYQEFRQVVIDGMTPTLLTYAPQILGLVDGELDRELEFTDELRNFIAAFAGTFANTYVASGQNQIEALIAESVAADTDPADAIEDRLDGWAETKAEKLSRGQSYEFMNAFSVAAYIGAGVKFLRWVSRGDSCPFCKGLDGRIAGIESFFVDAGTKIDTSDGSEPMLIRHKKRYGPLHKGCDCGVVAA